MSEEQVNQKFIEVLGEIQSVFYEMRREFPLPTELNEINGGGSILQIRDDAYTKKLMNWFETYLGVFSVGVPGKLGKALGIHFQESQEDVTK